MLGVGHYENYISFFCRQIVKHHPEPRRGEPTADGRRLDKGMLPFGVVSMGELKTSSRMIEQK